MTKVDTTIVATISNGKAIIYRPIGGDCTFSHYEKHKVIKGYIQKEKGAIKNEMSISDKNNSYART